MINQLSPIVRRQLVAARIAGMIRGADDALQGIRDIRNGVTGTLDRVALGLLESEILLLDFNPKEAVLAFATYVEPLLPDLDHRIAAVVADNKTLILMESFEPSATDDYYHLVDVRRLLGIELRDHSALLGAASEAAAGKHYDSLPAYWQQLMAAYRLQSWQAKRWAERDFAQECMQLNLLDEAAYHAMVSENKSAIESVAKGLLTTRSIEVVVKTLDRLLANSALRKHAAQVARMLAEIADVVPDDSVTRVAEFLMLHADWMPSGWHDAALLEQSWRSIEVLAVRLDDRTANSFATLGLKHPILQSQSPLRRHVINALNALTERLSREQLGNVADAALALISKQRSDIDYRESLDLLCHVAHCADDDLKTRIRSAVFPPGAQIADTLLMQAGPHLGWAPQRPESFSEGARKTAEGIRKQVQRVATGEEPAKIGAQMTLTSTTQSGQLVKHMYGAIHLVDALVTYRDLIGTAALRELLEAMLDMIAEHENLIVNRTALTSLIGQFADRFPPELDIRAAEVFDSIARGKITEPSSGQTHADATNPLNPFKLGSGNPVDLRGAALICLARLNTSRSTISTAYHKGILLDAMTNADPTVRLYAISAAEIAGNLLTPMEKTAMALGGLDPNPRVARRALHALSKPEGGVTFDPLTWHVVIRCVEAAVISADAAYRRAAANLINRVVDPPTDLKPRVAAAAAALRDDICYSVRAQLKESLSITT